MSKQKTGIAQKIGQKVKCSGGGDDDEEESSSAETAPLYGGAGANLRPLHAKVFFYLACWFSR